MKFPTTAVARRWNVVISRIAPFQLVSFSGDRVRFATHVPPETSVSVPVLISNAPFVASRVQGNDEDAHNSESLGCSPLSSLIIILKKHFRAVGGTCRVYPQNAFCIG